MSIRQMVSQLQGYSPGAATCMMKTISAPKAMTTSEESTCSMTLVKVNSTAIQSRFSTYLREINDGYENINDY